MKKYNCIFLDRDGTLNPDPGYINSINDYSFYDFTLSALSKIANLGNRFCIVTNQSGISRGLIKPKDLEEIHRYIKREFKENSLPLLDIYVCIDHPDQPTEKRKPGPGMFLEAELDHNILLMDCLMIGDSINDIRAGEMLGMDTMLVLTGHGQETYSNLLDHEMPTFIVRDLKHGAKTLCH